MKKRYTMPAQIVCNFQANNMVAISLGGPANPNEEVYVQEELWWLDEEDEEDETPIKNIKFFD
ncbi:MAG: hypothetical protein IKS36_02780 [Bacteroidales bacterium]|nr:hypothetical protein [Bacteroidales bacterium]